MDDLVIRGGEVLDGTGADPVRGDVAIRDGAIASIGPRYSGTARRTDFTLPYAPGAESKVFQGVTTRSGRRASPTT